MPLEKDVEQQEGITLTVKWGSFDALPSLPANQFIISHIENQFYLLFGEVTPPALTNLQQQKGDLPQTLEVKPLAKIVVPEGFMEKIAKAINGQLEKLVTK
jgi:hypothetical protein